MKGIEPQKKRVKWRPAVYLKKFKIMIVKDDL